MSTCLNFFLKESGVQPQFTAAYSPQQNGVSEQLNRTLIQAARLMINHASLSNAFWAEAISTVTYLRNCVVLSALKIGKTPYLLWYGEKPNLSHVRVLWCTEYVHISGRWKVDKKARKLRFIGYTETACNYRVWDEERHTQHDVISNEDDGCRLKQVRIGEHKGNCCGKIPAEYKVGNPAMSEEEIDDPVSERELMINPFCLDALGE